MIRCAKGKGLQAQDVYIWEVAIQIHGLLAPLEQSSFYCSPFWQPKYVVATFLYCLSAL